jgi:hypothetical protein
MLVGKTEKRKRHLPSCLGRDPPTGNLTKVPGARTMLSFTQGKAKEAIAHLQQLGPNGPCWTARQLVHHGQPAYFERDMEQSSHLRTCQAYHIQKRFPALRLFMMHGQKLCKLAPAVLTAGAAGGLTCCSSLAASPFSTKDTNSAFPYTTFASEARPSKKASIARIFEQVHFQSREPVRARDGIFC